MLPEVGAGIGRDCIAAAAAAAAAAGVVVHSHKISTTTAAATTTPPVAPDQTFTGLLRQESDHAHHRKRRQCSGHD